MMQTGDTICAISSALSPSARIIVRMSGPGAFLIADALCSGRRPGGSSETDSAVEGGRYNVSFNSLAINNCTFPAWVYRFRAPNSVTGEDVVEMHLPGNVLLARWTLEAMIARGARQAEAGEFTARAYFNGRIDLAQAEGVSATVSAHSQAELSAARQLLAGELSRRLRPLMDEIAHTLALVEAGIDFTDEDISFISATDAKARIQQTISQLEKLLTESSRFEPLTHLPRVVLVGRPNAGKSTLLNALAGHSRAVVSPVAGTTRDVLSATVILNRGSIQLFDVAGLETASSDKPEASAPDPYHKIAKDMQTRALNALETADFVVLVKSADDSTPPIDLPRTPELIIRTKSDLRTVDGISVSVLTGAGLAELRNGLDRLVFESSSGAALALNSRHIQCVQASIESLRLATNAVEGGAEILAMELRDALDSLGRVLGEVTPDDVIGRIFATFCIGK